MASMRVSLPGLFANVIAELPRNERGHYKFALDEVLKHLRETIAGEHTLDEFAQHYCLKNSAPDNPDAIPVYRGEVRDNGL